MRLRVRKASPVPEVRVSRDGRQRGHCPARRPRQQGSTMEARNRRNFVTTRCRPFSPNASWGGDSPRDTSNDTGSEPEDFVYTRDAVGVSNASPGGRLTGGSAFPDFECW